jgi:YVTN family beta-propeller protein
MFRFPKNFTALQFLVGLALCAAPTSALAFCYPLDYKHEHAIAVNPATNKIYAANMVFANDTCRIYDYAFQSAGVTIIDGTTNQINTVSLNFPPFTYSSSGGSLDLIAVAVNESRVDDSHLVAVIESTNNTLIILDTGLSPHVVAVNPATNRIYVTNNDNTVTVIDGATESYLGTATVGSNDSTFKHVLVVNSVTNKTYVTNGGDNTVSVIHGIIDGANKPPRTVNTVATGKHPFAVAVNTVTNRIYVTNNDNTVTIIDGATDSIINTLAVGSDNTSFKQALVVNQVTNKIYVINGNNNTVTVIDGATNTTSTLTTGITPRAIARNERTNKIYVANYGSNNVTVIDDATNTMHRSRRDTSKRLGSEPGDQQGLCD